MDRIKVVTIMGTRPEAIKMAPVVKELRRRAGEFEQVVVATAQHRELLDQVLSAFAIEPDVDLNLMQHDQSLSDFASRSLHALSKLFSELKPRAVLIQGDTTTVMTAALAAFYSNISVGHVEAGLRSFDRRNPFPEEINRRVASCLVDMHFAPTEGARRNLLNEGTAEEDIFVTGNTIVDALKSISLEGDFEDERLGRLDLEGKRMLLVTAHRRENHGEPLRSICRGLRMIAERFDDVEIVYPVHPNPNVMRMVDEELAPVERVSLVDPVSYKDLLRLMDRCYLILTDSGGMQEEAPSLHKPVLVLRGVTERPEVVEAGAGRLVGTDSARIAEAAGELLSDPREYRKMSEAENPFGDGLAAQRIVDALARRFGGG
ncbi:MAG TPA: UDP-N-acetylglucosamine 2-epimerase (non-hydrolyzing) [Blastocatellia bacterium]|nr:UDP-N-acetylglucosamine 2-epimerase (non-hydrolyzing) [Blastocatellia bacterium]